MTPDFVPPFRDLLMLQLLRPVFPNLPCHFSIFHLENHSRFCWSQHAAKWSSLWHWGQRFPFAKQNLAVMMSIFHWGVSQSVEHWTSDLAARVRSSVREELSDSMCAFLHVQMESNWAGLSVSNYRHTSKWCGTIKAIGNTDHTRPTQIHMPTPIYPLTGCGPMGERTSGKVINWTVRSLNHLHDHHHIHLQCQWETTSNDVRGLRRERGVYAFVH